MRRGLSYSFDSVCVVVGKDVVVRTLDFGVDDAVYDPQGAHV